MKKNEMPAAGSEISMTKKWWEWMKKMWKWVVGVCSFLIILITWLVINPTFDLREKVNIVTEQLVISNPAPLPPPNLVYTVADSGEPQCEYMPSPSYTLQTTRTIDFLTPLIWAPRKTYYPIHEGPQEVNVRVLSGNLQFQKMNDASVAVWAKGRRSSGEAAKIELKWEVSNFPDNVRLSSYTYNDYVRVDISNPDAYAVQYLAIVKSPPIKVNNVYMIETERPVSTYVPPTGSPQITSLPESLEIRSTGGTVDTFKVNVPFVIDVPSQTTQMVDIQIKEQPALIALVVQPPAVTAPPPPITQLWVLIILIIVAAGVISVIVVLPIVLIRRRHRS